MVRSATVSGGASLAFTVTPEGFRELSMRTAKFDEKLAKALRARIRTAALSVVSDIRSTVMGGSFTTEAGLRQGIADGLKVQVMTASKRPGVTITATKSKMPFGKAPMVKAWQKASFRHPVFGNTAVFATQVGHPYFDATILANKDKVTTAVNAAMTEAANTLAGVGL
jgi:hypothetical protein